MSFHAGPAIICKESLPRKLLSWSLFPVLMCSKEAFKNNLWKTSLANSTVLALRAVYGWSSDSLSTNPSTTSNISCSLPLLPGGASEQPGGGPPGQRGAASGPAGQPALPLPLPGAALRSNLQPETVLCCRCACGTGPVLIPGVPLRSRV